MQDRRPRSFTDPARTTPLGMLWYAIEFYAAASQLTMRLAKRLATRSLHPFR